MGRSAPMLLYQVLFPHAQTYIRPSFLYASKKLYEKQKWKWNHIWPLYFLCPVPHPCSSTWSFCCFHICLQHSLTHPGSASTPSTPRMTCHALPFSLCMALEILATNKCSLSALFIVGRMQWFYYAYAFRLSDQVSFWHASHGISSYFWHAPPRFVFQSCELLPPHTRMQLLAHRVVCKLLFSMKTAPIYGRDHFSLYLSLHDCSDLSSPTPADSLSPHWVVQWTCLACSE